MQVENDYDKDVYNGDLGIVSHIDTRQRGSLTARSSSAPIRSSTTGASSSWR
jgi:exodeoxyribonuclease V alpha subunit